LIDFLPVSKAFGPARRRGGFGIAAPEIITPMMHIKPAWTMVN
jgi:hypothetical protein